MTEQKNKTRDKCVNCGSADCKFVTNKLRYNESGTVVRCGECGLVRLKGAKDFEDKSKEFYTEEYAKKYHQGVKADLDSLFDSFYPVQQERIDKIKKYLKESDNLLEIGSSVGYFPHAVKKHVKDVYGVEYNTQEAEYATEVKEIKTSSKTLDDSEFGNMKFNHICLFQLLEHIPDPINFLQNLKEHLAPNGHIHIEIPNILDPLVSLFDTVEFRDFFYQTPHLYYFDPDTIKSIVSKTGLEIVSLQAFQQTRITNNLNWIHYKRPQPSRWDCIQAKLPTSYLDTSKVDGLKGKIDELIQKMNIEYKNILEQEGFTDNIFCSLKLI